MTTLLLVLSLVHAAVAVLTGGGDNVTDILHGLLVKYDSRVRPFYPHPPVVVSVSAFALVVSLVGESEITTSLVLEQSWTDPRVAFDSDYVTYININHDHTRELWLPDTFVTNEKTAHEHGTVDAALLFPNGTVVRSTRVTVTTHCQFDFGSFPFDTHVCGIFIGSHAFRTHDVVYVWGDKNVSVTSVDASFGVTGVSVGESTVSFNHGTTSRLSINVSVQRMSGRFKTRIFLPIFVFVTVSLLSLFSANDVAILNFFNMGLVNVFVGLVEIPRGGTAVTSYVCVCQGFIGAALIVCWSRRRRDATALTQRVHESDDIFNPRDDADDDGSTTSIYQSPSYSLRNKASVSRKKVAKFLWWASKHVRWALVGAFLIFNFAFFQVY